MKWSYQLLEHLLRDFRVETEIPDTEFPMMQNVLFTFRSIIRKR